MFTSGCQENSEKTYTTWQTTSIHDHLTQLGSTLSGNYHISLELFAFHISANILSNLFSLSSNVLEFSPFYSFFSEKIETIWWKQPQLPANKFSNQLALYPLSLLPSCYYWMKPPFKGCYEWYSFLLAEETVFIIFPISLLNLQLLFLYYWPNVSLFFFF